MVDIPDTRVPVGISAEAGRPHRSVMLQHLETIQAIVAALVDEDFERAQGLTKRISAFSSIGKRWPNSSRNSSLPPITILRWPTMRRPKSLVA